MKLNYTFCVLFSMNEPLYILSEFFYDLDVQEYIL